MASQNDGGADGNSKNSETTNESCSDGISNDGDQYIDCDDFDCSKTPEVTVCGSNNSGTTETNCSDGISNDGDKWIDCDDFDCQQFVHCKYDDLAKKAPENNALGCPSIAWFNHSVAFDDIKFSEGAVYPSIAYKDKNTLHVSILGLPSISEAPVVGKQWLDPLISISVADNLLQDPNSFPPAEGQAGKACWWNDTDKRWTCPFEYLNLIRGALFIIKDAIPTRPECGSYVYGAFAFADIDPPSGESAGVSFFAPIHD